MNDSPNDPAPQNIDSPAASPTPGHRSISSPVQVQSSLHATTGHQEAPSASASGPIHIPKAPSAEAPPGPVVVQVTSQPQLPRVENIQAPKRNAFVEYWRKAGGGSFMVSLAIHIGLLVGAYFVVETIVHEQKVDFLPGGGSTKGQAADQALSQSVQTKKRTSLNKSVAMQRIVSDSSTASIKLSDTPLDAIDVPEVSSLLQGGGAMGGAGFGSGGSGGGFGEGMGIGGADGIAFKPIFMFGQNLKARSIGVVMDVSGSMTPHLTKVIKELDRVAAGSPVVLYVGCGVKSTPKGKRLDDKTNRTMNSSKDEDRSFEVFWRKSHAKKVDPNAPPPDPKKKKKDEEDPVPENDVYQVLATRQQTYFIKAQGIEFSWLGLVADELRHVDAVYWFSDFQDATDDEQIERVLDILKRRKQKLFIHASQKGNSFAKISENLVVPSGGMVIEEEKKKDEKKKEEPKPAKK